MVGAEEYMAKVPGRIAVQDEKGYERYHLSATKCTGQLEKAQSNALLAKPDCRYEKVAR